VRQIEITVNRSSQTAILLLLLTLISASCTGGDTTATTGAPAAGATTSLLELDSEAFGLLPRPGEAPSVTDGVPHIQLTETSPASVVVELLVRTFNITNVEEEDSISSLPGAVALTVPSGIPARRGAMITGREFAHIHADPNGGGSLHMRLPTNVAKLVVDTGWGVYHPFHLDGSVPDFVLVFAPRTVADLDVVITIIEQAALFATDPGDDLLTERSNVQG
jgi:hypothetical protein